MKAIIKVAPEPYHVELREISAPAPSPGEVRISVRAAAICGSDLSAYLYRENYKNILQISVILGHEVTGQIDLLGEGVDTVSMGDRVLMESNRYCGSCMHCLSGYTTSCDNAEIAGLQFDGGMAEYVCIPAKSLHRLPEKLTYPQATVAQPLSVVMHGLVDRIKFPIGETVVIFGPGVLGILSAQVALAMGSEKVIVIGIDADEKVRLPLVEEYGFVAENIRNVVNYQNSANKSLKNVSLIIDCSGGDGVLPQAINMLNKRGQLLILGIPKNSQTLQFSQLVRNEIIISGSYTSGWNNYKQALSLIESGKVKVDPLIKEYAITDGIQGFIDAISGEVLKPVIIP